MNKVIYAKSNLKKAYKNNSFLGKIKDKFNSRFQGESFIKELDTSIIKIKFPPNFNTFAFNRNVNKIFNKFNHTGYSLALKTFRLLEYDFYTEFEKRTMAYSVVRSIQLILMTRNKSIRKSYIAIYDALDNINRYIIYELSKKATTFILISNNITKIRVLCEYIISNFGVSPIILNNIDDAIKCADFIITSRPLEKEIKCPLWCLDNIYQPSYCKDLIINEVTYNFPWYVQNLEISSELIGGIFNNNSNKSVDEILNYNGIKIDEIKFQNLKAIK